MRVVSIIAVLLLLVANALALVPEASALQSYLSPAYLSGAALVLGLIALVAILATGRGLQGDTARPAAEVARPASVPTPGDEGDAAVVSFLAMLQDKARLVDFAMDDINAYPDAQVGAAARVVHTGCKAVLHEHFRIRPVREESEGSTVQVPPGYAADEYRLLGRISGEAPFTGVLVHRGWRADAVNLPRVLRNSATQLPTVAPAEVELK